MNDNYEQTVIEPGDRVSKLAKEVCFQSHHNNNLIHVIPHQPGNFRGPVSWMLRRGLQEEMLRHTVDETGQVVSWSSAFATENDTAGGKPQFFSLIGTPRRFYSLGWEIITMNADDLARTGRFPFLMINDVSAQRVTQENFPLIKAMFNGYAEALAQSRLINITGETAVMKHSITAFCDVKSDQQLILTWGGSCVGLTRQSMLIDGSKIKSGMAVVGLMEDGYRCNGGQFLVDLHLALYGPTPKDVINDRRARKFAKALTVPSKSYARFITWLIGWNDDGTQGQPKAGIAGIAHITGGGIWEKFQEILPPGVGAELNDMPNPPAILVQAHNLSQGTSLAKSVWQCYKTFHGGCGMLLVCEPGDAHNIMTAAREFGIQAKLVGTTTESAEREILIDSRFGKPQILSSLRPF